MSQFSRDDPDVLHKTWELISTICYSAQMLCTEHLYGLPDIVGGKYRMALERGASWLGRSNEFIHDAELQIAFQHLGDWIAKLCSHDTKIEYWLTRYLGAPLNNEQSLSRFRRKVKPQFHDKNGMPTVPEWLAHDEYLSLARTTIDLMVGLQTAKHQVAHKTNQVLEQLGDFPPKLVASDDIVPPQWIDGSYLSSLRQVAEGKLVSVSKHHSRKKRTM